MKWTCHAHPVSRGGAECGHVNETGVRPLGFLRCELCGCTKLASDQRLKSKRERHGCNLAYPCERCDGKDAI